MKIPENKTARNKVQEIGRKEGLLDDRSLIGEIQNEKGASKQQKKKNLKTRITPNQKKIIISVKEKKKGNQTRKERNHQQKNPVSNENP